MKTRVSLVSVLLALVLIGGAGTVATAGDVTSKVDVSLWGRAKFDVHYDAADIGAYDFATYVTSDPDDYDGELNFNGRDTRFGFKGKMVDGEITCGAVGEIDFYGNNSGNNLIPRMRLGYAFVEKGAFSMRMGQDWIPIGQQNPATIDFGILSWGGNLWWRVPQITARYKMENGVEVLGGVMQHRVRQALDTDEMIPWVFGRVAYGGFMDGKGLIAVGGGVRPVTLTTSILDSTTISTTEMLVDTITIPEKTIEVVVGTDTTEVVIPAETIMVYEDVSTTTEFTHEEDLSYTPFVAIGEVVLPFTDKFSLNGEFYTGAGVGEEFLHYGFEYNAMHPEDVEAEDWGRAVGSMGGFASLSFKATDKMSINVGGGLDDPADEDMYGMALGSIRYTKNMVIFGNVKYAMNKHMGMGFEVMNFTTEYAVDAKAAGTTAGDDYSVVGKLDEVDTYDEYTGQRFTFSTWFAF